MILILIQQRTPVQTITPRINIIFMIVFRVNLQNGLGTTVLSDKDETL